MSVQYLVIKPADRQSSSTISNGTYTFNTNGAYHSFSNISLVQASFYSSGGFSTQDLYVTLSFAPSRVLQSNGKLYSYYCRIEDPTATRVQWNENTNYTQTIKAGYTDLSSSFTVTIYDGTAHADVEDFHLVLRLEHQNQ